LPGVGQHLVDAVVAFDRPELVSPAGDDRDAQLGVVGEIAPDVTDFGVAAGEGGGWVSVGLGDRDEQDPIVASLEGECLVLAPVDGGTQVVDGHG